jgi:DMSO/TMAO reductase YedYZ molybdopterin-dependent catalytic subunit
MVEGPKLPRREWMRRAGFAVLAVGASRVLGGNWEALAANLERGITTGGFPQVPGLGPEVTPNDQFYTVSINWLGDPRIDAGAWSLSVKGLVSSPQRLSYEELKSLPFVEEYATLKCIGDPEQGSSIGNALWRGVRLRELLGRAGGAGPDAVEIILRADDGYSDSFPLSKGLEDGTILAYEMNGAPLPRSHGYPARVIVPGIYGMKNVKWLSELEVADHDYKGYWEKRDWDDVAAYRTVTRIEVPRGVLEPGVPAFIAGVAFTGERRFNQTAHGAVQLGSVGLPVERTPQRDLSGARPDHRRLWPAAAGSARGAFPPRRSRTLPCRGAGAVDGQPDPVAPGETGSRDPARCPRVAGRPP